MSDNRQAVVDKRKPILNKKEKRKIAVIHIINKFKVKNEQQAFRCLMMYQDLTTSFCFVKPLLCKIALEIVMELFKIFTSYGPPSEVLVNSCNQEMVNNMATHMKALCPMFDITFIHKNEVNIDIAMEVVTKLHTWMEDTKRTEWEIGCCIVQREINTTSNKSSLTPHQLFFKQLGKDTAQVEDGHSSSDDTHSLHDDDTQELNIANVNSTSHEDPRSLDISCSDPKIKIKEEIIDIEESTSLNNYISKSDSGLLLPGIKMETPQVQIKTERL